MSDQKAKEKDAELNSDDVTRRIAETVTRFVKKYMALQPQSVLVAVHESHILVTLRQVACEAERDCASDTQKRELLEKLSSAAFDTVKSELEAEMAVVVGRAVRRSRINVDPVAGDAMVSFVTEESRSTEERD